MTNHVLSSLKVLAFVLTSVFVTAQNALPSFFITYSSESGNAGDTVTCSVRCKDFNDVLGLQFALIWDNTKYRKLETALSFYNKAHSKIRGGGPYSNFNLHEFGIRMVFNDFLEYLTLNDTTIFKFDLLLLKDMPKNEVCFDNSVFLNEIIYIDNNGEEQSTGFTQVDNCNILKFNQTGLTCRTNGYSVYSEKSDSLTLTVEGKNGTPPYTYKWTDGEEGSQQRFKAPKGKDSLFFVKVTDAKNNYYLHHITPRKVIGITIYELIDTIYATTADEFLFYNLKNNLKYGYSPFQYSTNISIKNGTDNISFYNPKQNTLYEVIVKDNIGDTTKYFIQLLIKELTPSVSIKSEFDPIKKEYKFTPILNFIKTPYKSIIWNDTDTNFTKIISVDQNKLAVIINLKLSVIDAIGEKHEASTTLVHNIYNLVNAQYSVLLGEKEKVISINEALSARGYFNNYKSNELKYQWDNGKQTEAIKAKVDPDKLYFVTVTAPNGERVIGFIGFRVNSTIFLKISPFYTLYSDSVSTINFSSNPINSYKKWKVTLLDSNKVIQVIEGRSKDKATFVAHNPFKERTIRLKIESHFEDTTIIFPTQIENGYLFNYIPFPIILNQKTTTYSFCKSPKELILKPELFAGLKPYFFDWGEYGSGSNLDSIIINYPEDKTYKVIVKDDRNDTVSIYFVVKINQYATSITDNFPELNCGNLGVNFQKSPNSTAEYYYEFYDKNLMKQSDSEVYTTEKFRNIQNLNETNDEYYVKVKYRYINNNQVCLSDTTWQSSKLIKHPPIPFITYKKDFSPVCAGTEIDLGKVELNNLDLGQMNLTTIRSTLLPYGEEGYYILVTDTLSQQKFTTEAYINHNGAKLYDPKYIIQYLVKADKSVCELKTNFNLVIPSFTPKDIVLENYSKFQDILNNNETLGPISVNGNNDGIPIGELEITLLDNKNLTTSFTNNSYIECLVQNNSSDTSLLSFMVQSNKFGCKGKPDTFSIKVLPGFQKHIESFTTTDETGNKIGVLFSPNGQSKIEGFSISPNPVTDVLNCVFEQESSESFDVEIFNTQGKLLQSSSFNTYKGVNKVEIDVSNLLSGSYYLTLKNSTKLKTTSFIKL